MKSKTISVNIAETPDHVYEYASNPANLPAWVPSFCKSIEFVDGQWVVDSPFGPAVFAFADTNPYGVLDHTIAFSTGLTLMNPMRVVPNGSGSELLFTLFQHDGMTDQQFKDDEAQVLSDLETLRRLLENKHG
ncbi:MAG: SRPBCC family protein [Gammaproteobacteria bacterium]|nr:SRPBCC family protein [Gammaproteobacteria bacterium]